MRAEKKVGSKRQSGGGTLRLGETVQLAHAATYRALIPMDHVMGRGLPKAAMPL